MSNVCVKGNSKSSSDSQIKKFYSGKHIFLTGCTGFLGNLILEKLLRSCSDLGKLYIMMRPKKGVSVEDRLSKLFKNELFDTLRKTNPNFMEKLVVIYGDLEKSDLGISPEDRRRLVENVNIIIHNASMVYFLAKVSRILRVNVIATQKILELAAECPRLNTMVYVSTAFSHPYNKTPEEKFYPPPADLKIIEDIIRADEENETGISAEVMNDFIGKWINAYSFSKATAEGVVEDFSRRTSLPCIVFRPSIVGCTIKEPIPSWIGNQNGPVLLSKAAMQGYVHVIYGNENFVLDAIPGDMTINALLVSIWDYSVHRKSNEAQVYTYGSSDWNPLLYKDTYLWFKKVVNANPSSKMVWYPFYLFIPNFYLFFILHMLFHVFPALIVDAVRLLQGKKAIISGILLQAMKHQHVLAEFINCTWCIKVDRLKEVRNRVNPTDSEEFLFDLSAVNIGEGVTMFLKSVRNLLNEPMSATAKRRLRNLKILHYTVTILFALFVLYCFYSVLCNIF